MIDLSHISEVPGLRVFLPQGVDANSWQAWQKPRGFVMATIYAIGPGGGGGSGRSTSPTVTPRPGGGGGGSGGLSRLTIPLFLLPDTLYIRVTPGGSGGASVTGASNGTTGNTAFSPFSTLVSIYPNSTAQYLYLVANAGGGGGGGAVGSTGGGGSAASAASVSVGPLGNLGATLFIGGNSGSGTSISQGTSSQIYGGAGGGGGSINTNGNVIFSVANSPFLQSAGGAAGTGAGGNGFSYTTIFPMKIYGGTGGGSNMSGAGGAGGAGAAWGAGGGGGGGGNPSGAGGDGGPGCVIIQCW